MTPLALTLPKDAGNEAKQQQDDDSEITQSSAEADRSTSSSSSSSSPSASAPSDGGHYLLTICFGANDSCLPSGFSSAQSVPLESYTDNLTRIIQLLKGKDGGQNPNLHIIIIGPPQYDAKAHGLFSQRRHNLDAPPLTRDVNVTQQYSHAAASVASSFHLPFIDLFSLTSDWIRHLCDGLHLSASGNHLLFTQLIQTIERHYPHLAPHRCHMDGPLYTDIPKGDKKDTETFFQRAASE